LYESHVKSTLSRIDDATRILGLLNSSEVSGRISMLLDVPGLFSGALQSDYIARSEKRDSHFTLNNLNLSYDAFLSSGSLQADSFDFISHFGDVYMKYHNMTGTNIITSLTKKVFDEYDNVWLAQTSAMTFSWKTEADITAERIANNLINMTLKDVGKYATTYHIWKPTSSVTESGSLRIWSIDMDRDRVVELADALSRDLSGSGLLDDEKKGIHSFLSTLAFSGTLAFDTSDSSISELDLAISQSGGVRIWLLRIATSENRTQIALHTDETNSTISFDLQNEKEKKEANAIFSLSGSELARVSVLANFMENHFHDLRVSATYEGVSVMLEHTEKDRGNFEWKLTLPVGLLTWNGTIKDDTLWSFALKWVIPDGSIDMTLTQSGESLVWPIAVVQSGQKVFEAIVGLISQKDRFALDVKVPPLGSGATDGLHFNIDTTVDMKKSGKDIEIPKDIKPMNEFMEKLDAVLPKDDFIEEAASGSMIPDSM
jgi:hypothetical protein